mgnify:CR=1 FL=1
MPIPAGPYAPTNALVVQAFVGSRPGILPSQVAGKLPRDPSAWADLGFIVVSIIGGSPDVDIPVRHPLAQIDAYAVTLDAAGTVSAKPPVAKANWLAELVRTSTDAGDYYSKPVTMPANYAGAIVLGAAVVGEPREITDDPSGYARVTLDLALDWARA